MSDCGGGDGGCDAGNFEVHDHNDCHDYYGPHSFSKFKSRYKAIIGRSLAVILIIVAAVLTGLQFKKESAWTKTTGTIVATESCGETQGSRRTTVRRRTKGSGSSGTTYKAVIEYAVCNDRCETYTFRTNSCSDPPPKVGSQVAVLYEPGNPTNAMDASFMGAWFAPIVLGGMAVVVLLLTLPCAMGKYPSVIEDGAAGDDCAGKDGRDCGGDGDDGGGGDCGSE